MADEPLIAVFVDFENLALGVGDMKPKTGKFEVELILKRLLEKGRIVFKRAYCDWSNYRQEVRDFHGQGIELIDIPQTRMGGKNSADIHMVVDALELCHTKMHIDTFALLSGDSDFSPLVAKLKENDRRVIGCGIKSSTSNLLVGGCDEFIFYDDLVSAAQRSRPRQRDAKEKVDKKEEGVDRLLEIIFSLVVEYEPLWGSLVKQTLRRVNPGFNESNYGFNSFGDLLKAAEKRGYIELDYDRERGNYKIRLRED